MIENFLRPPRGLGELVADAVRLFAIVGVGIAAIWWDPTDAGIVALALPAVLAPRFLAVRPAFDIAFGVTVLVAAGATCSTSTARFPAGICWCISRARVWWLP